MLRKQSGGNSLCTKRAKRLVSFPWFSLNFKRWNRRSCPKNLISQTCSCKIPQSSGLVKSSALLNWQKDWPSWPYLQIWVDLQWQLILSPFILRFSVFHCPKYCSFTTELFRPWTRKSWLNPCLDCRLIWCSFLPAKESAICWITFWEIERVGFGECNCIKFKGIDCNVDSACCAHTHTHQLANLIDVTIRFSARIKIETAYCL